MRAPAGNVYACACGSVPAGGVGNPQAGWSTRAPKAPRGEQARGREAAGQYARIPEEFTTAPAQGRPLGPRSAHTRLILPHGSLLPDYTLFRNNGHPGCVEPDESLPGPRRPGAVIAMAGDTTPAWNLSGGPRTTEPPPRPPRTHPRVGCTALAATRLARSRRLARGCRIQSIPPRPPRVKLNNAGFY